jgi:hypothetical protein
MKYLKKYRLFESNSNATFLIADESEIHSICKEYGIENYTINGDGSIDVDGSVDLNDKGLNKLPLKFNKVSGGFYCGDNQLTSLEGAPQSVDGSFHCYRNDLMSLEGGPKNISGIFDCSYNKLKSLKGAPKELSDNFICSYNELTSLEGSPQSVDGYLFYHSNKIVSLEGLEFKSFNNIDLVGNPINEIVKDWINNDNREELIEYFIDMNIIQDNKLIMVRLEAFYEDMNLEMDIDFDEVKKYYEIIE